MPARNPGQPYAEALPAAFEGLDVDVEAAQRAGAHAEQFSVIRVQ